MYWRSEVFWPSNDEVPTEPHCPGESDIDGEIGIKIVGGNVESVSVLSTVVSCELILIIESQTGDACRSITKWHITVKVWLIIRKTS